MLGRAHVVLLQEMDGAGTATFAAALGLHHVYHPAFVHDTTGRPFGNAILSRWPLVDDGQVVLPHVDPRSPVRRAAVYATATTPRGPLRLACLHLATPLQLGRAGRRDQVDVAVRHLGSAPHVVLGGDFNSHRMARAAAAHGLDWPTRRVGATVGYLFSVDHVLTRGLRATAIGRVTDTRDTTDHAAVWARLIRAT